MSMRQIISRKLESDLSPEHLEVIDESGMHDVPAGAESHFKVVVAARRFDGMGRVARHRLVNEILRAELSGRVHALAVHAMTPDEYFCGAGRSPASPACLGGGERGSE